jgi:hypothetical protein
MAPITEPTAIPAIKPMFLPSFAGVGFGGLLWLGTPDVVNVEVSELVAGTSDVKMASVGDGRLRLECVVDCVVVVAGLGGGTDISLVAGCVRGVAVNEVIIDAVTVAIEARVMIEMPAEQGGRGVSACRTAKEGRDIENDELRSSLSMSNCGAWNKLVALSVIVLDTCSWNSSLGGGRILPKFSFVEDGG